MREESPFNLGIVSAKKGKTLEDNPFDKDEEAMKHQWWKEGFGAATGDKYATKDGVKLCNRPVYEKCGELIE